MSNSSVEHWSIADLDGGNEVSLHQYGWAVTTVGGTRYDLPPRRGSDMTVAYRPGQVHRRKLADARPMTLQFFMVGWEPATGDAPVDQLTQWNDNWDFLRRLVYRHSMLTDQRFRLIRRWFLTADTFPTTRGGDFCIQGDPGVPAPGKRLLTAWAQAEMTGSMDPSMTGRFRAEFSMDMTLSDPFFYGDQVTATMQPNTTTFVYNDGHDALGSGFLTVDLYGPLTNPRITNLTTNPDSWWQWTGTVAAGDYLHVRAQTFTVDLIKANGTSQNKIGNVTSFGSRFWGALMPGSNKVQFSASGSGHAVLNFRPAYV